MFQYTVDPSHCSEETVGNLRQRLNVMREIVKVRNKECCQAVAIRIRRTVLPSRSRKDEQ
jgi:hypothetical protein